MPDAVRTAPVFSSLDALAKAWLDLPQPNSDALDAAHARQAVLTKPAGSLGRLEDLAIWFSGWRGEARPSQASAQAIIFAGNHGVAARGVSPYPADVTAQMVANFEAGGAAANQLADLAGARFAVVPLDLDAPTADFTETPAMDEPAFLSAVQAGAQSVAADTDVIVLGEMGIGNTTAAAALSALLAGESADAWTGAGAGVDAEGLARKRAIVDAGIARHRDEIAATPEPLRSLEALRRVGGREMAAILGALLAARQHRAVVLLDGYIVTSVAAAASRLAPDALAHCAAGHRSAEAAHGRLLDSLGLTPLLDLGLRLGEGSGGLLALGVLQAALACHCGMASFAEAGVSDREG